MNYQTFKPENDLSALVKCYWTLDGPGEDSPQKQVIVSDGCMEMIFHYGDLYRQYLSSGESIIQPRCFVIGQLTEPLEIQPTGRTGIFSVRFHPDGFAPLSPISLKGMENQAVPLTTIFGGDVSVVEMQVLAAGSTEERIECVEAFLTARMLDERTTDYVVRAAVETILTANGQLPIDELSRRAGISRRQLERKFVSLIGMSPKRLSRTVRLQATLKAILSGDKPNLTSLAYDADYYDQAHFIRDFKEFTGMTPSEFYGEGLTMSAFFYGTE